MAKSSPIRKGRGSINYTCWRGWTETCDIVHLDEDRENRKVDQESQYTAAW